MLSLISFQSVTPWFPQAYPPNIAHYLVSLATTSAILPAYEVTFPPTHVAKQYRLRWSWYVAEVACTLLPHSSQGKHRLNKSHWVLNKLSKEASFDMTFMWFQFKVEPNLRISYHTIHSHGDCSWLGILPLKNGKHLLQDTCLSCGNYCQVYCLWRFYPWQNPLTMEFDTCLIVYQWHKGGLRIYLALSQIKGSTGNISHVQKYMWIRFSLKKIVKHSMNLCIMNSKTFPPCRILRCKKTLRLLMTLHSAILLGLILDSCLNNMHTSWIMRSKNGKM